jgi:hypothetical protein
MQVTRVSSSAHRVQKPKLQKEAQAQHQRSQAATVCQTLPYAVA